MIERCSFCGQLGAHTYNCKLSHNASAKPPPLSTPPPPPLPKTAEHKLILQCRGCATKIRIVFSLSQRRYSCPQCRTKFSAFTDSFNVLQVDFDQQPDAEPVAPGDYYYILGISRTATSQQIKEAYRLRMQEYHPDKVAHLGVELRKLAERKAKEINAAYDALSRI